MKIICIAPFSLSKLPLKFVESLLWDLFDRSSFNEVFECVADDGIDDMLFVLDEFWFPFVYGGAGFSILLGFITTIRDRKYSSQ